MDILNGDDPVLAEHVAVFDCGACLGIGFRDSFIPAAVTSHADGNGSFHIFLDLLAEDLTLMISSAQHRVFFTAGAACDQNDFIVADVMELNLREAAEHLFHLLHDAEFEKLLCLRMIGILLALKIIRLNGQNLVALSGQLNAKKFLLRFHLLRGKTAGEQAGNKIMAKQRHTLRDLMFQLTLCIDLAGNTLNNFDQIFIVNGFQQVLFNLQIDGGLGIPEILIAGHQDCLAGQSLTSCLTNHFQAIHHRHTNITDDNVRLQRFHHLKALFTIGSGTDYFITKGVPVDILRKTSADNTLIIHYYYFVHGYLLCSLSFFTGKNADVTSSLTSHERSFSRWIYYV